MYMIYGFIRTLVVRWFFGLLFGTRVGTAVLGAVAGGIALLYVAHTQPMIFLSLLSQSAAFLT